MHPEGRIQLEIDLFYPCENVLIQVGHVEISDCNYRYWPLAYIVAESEDKDSCKRLLNTGIDMMEIQFGNKNYGQVSTLLYNGGTAILSAIDKINKERSLIGKEVIKKRRCFSHVICMHNTKGTNGYKVIKKR